MGVDGGDGADEVGGAGVAVTQSLFDANMLEEDMPITNEVPVAL